MRLKSLNSNLKTEFKNIENWIIRRQKTYKNRDIWRISNIWRFLPVFCFLFSQFSIFFNYLFRYEFSDSRRVFWCVTWLYLKKIFFWFYSWGWKTLIANPPGQNSSNQKSIKLKVACNGQPQRNLKCNIWFSKKWENQPTLEHWSNIINMKMNLSKYWTLEKKNCHKKERKGV